MKKLAIVHILLIALEMTALIHDVRSFGAALILNIARILEGPCFFLEVCKTPPSTVVMWFAIIGALCLVLAAVYMKLREKAAGRDQRMIRD